MARRPTDQAVRSEAVLAAVRYVAGHPRCSRTRVTTQIISQGQCLLGEAEPAMRKALSSGLVQQNTGTIPANLTVTAAGRALLASK
jgi:hypothetical protein